MTLTADQLVAIDRHLRKENWLLNEALIAELTDHYANAVADAMSRGTSFELAILDVHKEFGGRKGLLKMEEEYAGTQARNNSRMGWALFRSYFRQPRLAWTMAVLGLVYGFTAWANQADTPLLTEDHFLLGIVLAGVVYLAALVWLIKAAPSGLMHQTGIAPGIFLGQGGLALSSLSMFLRLLPVESFAYTYPFPFSLLVTLVIIYEAATVEMIVHVLRQSRPYQTA